MSFKTIWKVFLQKLSFLDKSSNEYNAEVSTVNHTRRNADIAAKIVEIGGDTNEEHVLSILNLGDQVVRDFVCNGESVLTNNCHYLPRVNGVWLGSSATFDPDHHKITVNISPSAAMRQCLQDVGVEVLGVKPNGAFIGLVTDTLTGLTDGSITPGDDIRIEGDKLRIAPDDDDTLGVFFVNTNDESFRVTRRLTRNEPKTVLARVPELVPGDYTLVIKTRFANSNTLLKNVRTIQYEIMLSVV